VSRGWRRPALIRAWSREQHKVVAGSRLIVTRGPNKIVMAGRLLWAVPLAAAFTLAAFSLTGTRLDHFLAPPTENTRHAESPSPAVHRDKGAPSTPGASAASRPARRLQAPNPSGTVGDFGDLLAVLSISAAALALLVALLAVTRIRARRARIMQRVLITPGRASEAPPVLIAGLIEALDRVTRDRWWVRLVRGTPPVATLELVSGPHANGGSEQRVGIAVPLAPGHIDALKGVIASRYPDATLTVLPAAEAAALRRWLRVVVRLKKAKLFARPIARPGERSLTATGSYDEAPVDALLAMMAEVREKVLVQFTITPVPNHFQRIARAYSEPRHHKERAVPAPTAVEQREDRAAAEAVVFRPLNFCDIRVGAESYQVARQVAGAIEGIAEGGENHLRQRTPVLRRRLYIERTIRAESNPLPSWLRGVYSSLEIAGLWHLPTPFAKNLAIERSNLPQLPAPPEVLKLKDSRRAIATDLRGTYVGIRPGDFKYGVQVSGVQGGGKTSLLAKIAEARARETNTAVIILDPKDELMEAAVALMPSWRTVRVLDVAQPLFGIALRTAERDLQAEAAIFSEAMVDVSRTEEGESQALNASQRSFKMARGATLALEENPTFWHTARWLASDDDAAAWRTEKIATLAGDPAWHGVWDHFARILPAQLKKSPAQAVMRLEAPYNKIQTLLGDDRLSTVLHHPVTVSFDEVIRRREVLIVAARVPQHPDGDVLLKFFVQLIHRAILGQQQLPEEERARVALIGDDAQHLFSPTIARMMEHDRSAGLDIALGWQHGGQVSRELAPALDGLCNSRFYLRAAEEDARRAINRLNPAYDDRLTATLPDLRRRRVEVNQLTGLPINHALAVLQAESSVSSAFTVETIPWDRDPKRMEEIEAWMRDEGGYDPEVIAPPQELTARGKNADLDDVGKEAEGEGQSKPGGENETPTEKRVESKAPTQGADGDPRSGDGEARARKVRRGQRQAEVTELGASTDKPLSEGFGEVELMREKATSIHWEEPPREAPNASHKTPNAEQRSILEALYELRVLSAAQIRREFLMAMSERQARRELQLLFQRGMVRRFELGMKGGRGRGKRIYVLDQGGFDLLCASDHHPASGRWRAPELHSPQHVVHDLARNEWLFGFRSLAPRQLVAWRGIRSSKVEVPLRREGREAPRRLVPTDLRENAPVDFGGSEFGNVIPDLTLELQLTPRGEPVQTDLLAEIEFGNNDAAVREKAVDYDGFLTGWWREHPRYQQLKRPPIVFFLVPDLQRARRFIEVLDPILTSHLIEPAETQTREQRQQGITPEPRRLYLGRRNIFVAVARDVSQRTLRAWRVPALPPEVRRKAARNAAERRKSSSPVPRTFMLIDPKEQVDPAT
jgi:hypothetical protein